jgi:hypothetical protein
MVEYLVRRANGEYQNEAARSMGLSVPGARRLDQEARGRMGCDTLAQAVAAAICRRLLVAGCLALAVALQALELAQVTSPVEGTEVARRMPGGRRKAGGERMGRRGHKRARRDRVADLALDADDLTARLVEDRADTWDQLDTEGRVNLSVAVHVAADQAARA